MADSDDQSNNDFVKRLISDNKKLKKQIVDFQSEMDDKETELTNALKDAEKKWRVEQRKLNESLHDKEEKISDLETNIVKLTRKLNFSSTGSSFDYSYDNHGKGSVEQQTKMDNLLEEINKKDQQICDMETELNMANVAFEKEKEMFQEKLKSQNKILGDRDGTIKELKKNIESVLAESSQLRKQIKDLENELSELRENAKNFDKNQKRRDSSGDDASQFLGLLKMKDEKIAQLKQKLSAMKENQSTDSSNANSQLKSLFSEISLCSGQRVSGVDEAISVIKNTFRNSQSKERYEGRITSSRDDGNRVRNLQLEIQDLNDQLQDLEMKLQSTVKKHKKELAKKDVEFQEAQEELEDKLKKSSNDSKMKTQLAEMKNKVEDLENRLERKEDEIKEKEKLFQDLQRKYMDKVDHIKGLEFQIGEFQNQARDLTKANNDLNRKLKDMERELKDSIVKKDEELQKKQTAIENMKTGINDNKVKTNQLETQLHQKTREIEDLRRSNQKLDQDNNHFRMKINNQETELREYKMKNFSSNKQDRGGHANAGNAQQKNWFPSWWKDHM